MMSLLRDELEPVLGVLSDLGGYFVFSDDDGQEYVIAQREEFERVVPSHVDVSGDVQEEDEMTEIINRDIALAASEEAVDDLDIRSVSSLPPARIKFEPLKGDISPDLQE